VSHLYCSVSKGNQGNEPERELQGEAKQALMTNEANLYMSKLKQNVQWNFKVY
jgi:hypothetical protein